MIGRFLDVRFSAGLGVVSLAGATVIACGIRTPLTDGLHDESLAAGDAGKGAAAPPADAAPGADAADSGPAIGDAGADVALPPTNLGNILLTSGAYQSGTIQTLKGSAAFYSSVAASGCSVAPVGGCTLETCTPTGVAYPYASAGVIDVSGGLYPLVLQAGSGGLYAPPAPAGDGGALTLWHGGETLIMTASGRDVPPFAINLTAPRQITMVSPLPSLIARSADLWFSWFGASAGMLTVDLNASAGPVSYYLECQFDVGAGGAAIPQAALAALPAGVGTLTVSTVSKSEVSTGGWKVIAFAQTNANGPDGLEYVETVGVE